MTDITDEIEAIGKKRGESTMQDLLGEAEQLRQSIATLEVDWKALAEENEAVVKKLKGEIEEKSLQNTELKRGIEILRSEYQEKVRTLKEREVKREGEVQNLRDEAGRLRQTVNALQATREVFGQISSDLKRQLEESRSRLEVLSQGLTARSKEEDEVQSDHEEGVSTQDEIQ